MELNLGRHFKKMISITDGWGQGSKFLGIGGIFIETESDKQRSGVREKAGSRNMSLNNNAEPQEQLCRGESRAGLGPRGWGEA